MESVRMEKKAEAGGDVRAGLAWSGYHDFANASEVLSAEHRVIERVLNVVDGLTRIPLESSLERWRKALDFIRHFADECHHLKEEKILFPVMEEHGIPRDGGPIGMMIEEHEEARGYVRSMGASLDLGAAADEAAKRAIVENAKAYLRLLREHIQKEDDILFRMADEAIPSEEQKKLLLSFEEHEAKELGARVHEKYLKIAQELEAEMV